MLGLASTELSRRTLTAFAVACLVLLFTVTGVTMGNALRLIVFILALAAVGVTATLAQLWVNHRALARLHAANESKPPLVMRDYQRDQHYANGLLLSVTFIALLAVALIRSSRLTPESEDKIHHQRHEMNQVERLAQTTVAQEESLRLERAERYRADENLHLQQLLLNQALAEKIRLGRDLHDGVIQSLYATGLTLEASRQKHSPDPVVAEALFERGIALLNQSIREIRSYIQPLTEINTGTPLSFSNALALLLEDVKGGREVAFLLRIDESAETQLDPAHHRDLLQIVREAVSNALRHGAATQIQIRLHEEDARLALLIQDNGSGFDTVAVSKNGHGLTNFNARAAALEADFKLHSQPGQGTRIVLTLPTLQNS